MGNSNEGVFADMERADDMVEVVVGADILVFAIDLLASGIKDLEGNACDARLRGGDAQGGVGFLVGGDRNVKAREGHVHSSGFELCGLTENYVPKLVFAKTMDVTVAGNTTQNVTMDFDKRITSSFRLKVIDAYPDEVTKVRLTADASKPKYLWRVSPCGDRR